jgi:hypothetical protein
MSLSFGELETTQQLNRKRCQIPALTLFCKKTSYKQVCSKSIQVGASISGVAPLGAPLAPQSFFVYKQGSQSAPKVTPWWQTWPQKLSNVTKVTPKLCGRRPFHERHHQRSQTASRDRESLLKQMQACYKCWCRDATMQFNICWQITLRLRLFQALMQLVHDPTNDARVWLQVSGLSMLHRPGGMRGAYWTIMKVMPDWMLRSCRVGSPKGWNNICSTAVTLYQKR